MEGNAYAVYDEFSVRIGTVFAKNVDLAMFAAKNEYGSGKIVDRITFQPCDGCGAKIASKDLLSQGVGLLRKLCGDCDSQKDC